MFIRRRSTRRKAPTLTRQLVLLVVFFGLMLTPVMSNMATAFEADRAQALAQDGGDEPTEPVDEPTDPGEDPTEPVDQTLIEEEATEIPTETPTEVPLETGMVTVWKGECPIENFDPYQASADELSSTCSANGTATFQVTDSSGGSAQSGPSGSSFDVLAGNVSIGEELPAGYEQPVVVCQSDMSGVSQPSVSNAAVSIQVNAEEMVVCTFYNVPGGLSTLYVYKWSCPAGYDYTAMNADPKVDCTTGQNGVNFTLSDADPQTSDLQTMTGDSTPYMVMFGSIPAGQYTVTETVPDGYGDPFVWDCTTEPGQNGSMATPLATGSTLNLDVPAGAEVTCNWYNVPEGNEVTVYKWDCPEGTDTAGTEEYLLAECATEHLNIPISLTDDGGPHDTTTQANGTTWNNVVAATGSFTITEELPDGYGDPVVYCWMLLPDETESTLVPSSGGSITPNVPVDMQWNYYCNWFNLPGGDGNEVTVYKWNCPVGTDPTGTEEYLLTECSTQHTGIPFDLVDANGSHPMDSQADGTTWNDVVRGTEDVTITETIPSGYVDPVVYCWSLLPDETDPAMVTSTGGTVAIPNLGEGQWNYYCNWFNIPSGESTDLIIYKWTCPEGYDPYGAGADPLVDCEAGPDGVTFNAEGPNGYTSQTDTGDSIQYAVMFGGLEAGLYTITETPPDGYTGMVWDCTEGTTYGGGAENTMTLEAMGGQVTCNWLNIPGFDHQVWVYKWVCPEGTVASDHDEEWFFENCTQALDGIEYRLDYADGWSYGTTSGGQYVWDMLPAGPIGLQEEIPAEYEEPVVFCSTDGNTYEQFPTVNGYITYNDFGMNAEGNTAFICHWFNIYGGPGEITVYKWTCPEGYDPHAWGVDPYADCTEGPNGITFTNDGPDGYTSQTDTGDSMEYAVYWGGLEPGEYTVTEQVPDGIAAVFVWDCYGQREGELRPTPLTTEPTVTLDLHAGEAIICHWFNVPENPDGTLTVIKYECSTKTWVSEVDCEIYEGGQTFDLAQWNGAAWDVIATNTTDGFGRYTWYDLEPGEYWVAEQGRDWCHMTSAGLSADGNWLNVEANAETVVKVYNCTGEPGKPGKTPTKYPNTGVPASFREAWRLAA
jgi:hypothetical protein